MLKIVDHVDQRIEEPNTEFVNAVEPTPEDLTNNVSDYVISKNDLLTIEISDLTGPGTQTVKTTRVTESGNMSLPYLSSPIHAEGLTETQLEQTIIKRYRTENIIQKAQVSVIVTEARGRAFSILGQVTRPGQYAIVDPEFRVLDALVLAGETISPLLEDLYIIRKEASTGSSRAADVRRLPRRRLPGSAPATWRRGALPPRCSTRLALAAARDAIGSDSAGRTCRSPRNGHGAARFGSVGGRSAGSGAVPPAAAAPAPATAAPAPTAPAPTAGGFEGFHDLAPPSDIKIIHIPLSRLRNGELQYNIVIKPHDQIIVQALPTGVYYMGGHVQNPGAYTLTGQRVTLKQAIISAHMLDQLAIPSERTSSADWDRARKFSSAWISTRYLPVTSRTFISSRTTRSWSAPTSIAPFLSAIRGAFRITYGFGFLYDRNFAVNSRTGVQQ